ncbi:hypothetical protein QBZ16_003354 [Prototheca wickerhamii]|uniref:Peptidase S9 prolyl oligopeptidase catalytic domain-containing protein n=1 Tax=Prototheca wickerhamii TaxID=3111 RepID=A0AAD9IHD3_PROWI|nr:hypothetical protein QBZ16_003354 [Prototheca wickerhamii]
MHPTQSDVDGVAEKAGDLARRGFLAVCMDCRYHGARSGPSVARRDPAAYQRALVAAWRGSGERPFLLDNVRDLLTLADYLELHGPGLGADPARLGVTGVSLGGMHSWLWAVADTRVKAAAPIIGVQGFKYALENDCFHGRVSSLPILFAAAAKDLDPERQRITSAVVRAVWDKLLPGLLEEYDAPRSLPAIAPRSLLVVSGAQDPRCPIKGVYAAMQAAMLEYDELGAEDALDLIVEEETAHECTPTMWSAVLDWLQSALAAK